MKQLRGKRIVASDGAAGTLNELYFDVGSWTVRYLAVSGEVSTPGTRLLLPAAAAAIEALGEATLVVAASRAQLARAMVTGLDERLMSGRESYSYTIQTREGTAGQLDDLLVGLDWSIAGLIVRARDWLLPGSQVEVPTSAVSAVHRGRRVVALRYTDEELCRLPRAGWRLRLT